jgi:hypothetical protein
MIPLKELADMTEPELRDYCNRMATAIEDKLPPGEGRRGRCMFALLFWPTIEGGIAQYVSNAQRPGMIKMLRETADRLERRQDVTREG